jgi:DNA-binding MarR family transcriptional regulator
MLLARPAGEDGSIHPTDGDFEHLLRFRVTLRRFLRWSEDHANSAGLTPAQHQLLVAIKGHPGPQPPAIRELADYLLLQSHSTVGLVDRAEAAGFVRRRPDGNDARVVRVELTGKGDRLVTGLTEGHLAELHNLAAALSDLLPEEDQRRGRSATGRLRSGRRQVSRRQPGEARLTCATERARVSPPPVMDAYHLERSGSDRFAARRNG